MDEGGLDEELESIRVANQMDDYLKLLKIETVPFEGNFCLKCCNGLSLSVKQSDQIFDLTETNVKEIYVAVNWGWTVSEKRKELFHPLMKFITLWDTDEKIIAFVGFKFDWDDIDEPEYAVLYCYELHVINSFRGKGAGRYLMTLLLQLAQQFRMRKVMLTCFKMNEEAMKFYLKIGFKIDSNSPSQCGFNKEPHEILSIKVT